jgi:hypothetical protein
VALAGGSLRHPPPTLRCGGAADTPRRPPRSGPARSDEMVSPPSGRNHPHPPRPRGGCPRGLALPMRMTFRVVLLRCGRGAVNPPVPRVANFSEARGHHAVGSDVRCRWREGPRLPTTSEHRGASRRARHAWSRVEERAAAAAGKTQGCQATNVLTPLGDKTPDRLGGGW